MGFNEKVHAYIAAKFYSYLVDRFGDRGKAAFVHATQYYAMQRGRRMAQRAIRDGAPLTQETYNYYGEWVNTEEIKAEGSANRIEKTKEGALKITVCPWNTQFREMGSLEAGEVYCTHLDSAISRGFNPYLGYEVDQNLNGAAYCIHRLTTDDIAAGSARGKNPAGLRPFSYHCAHSYYAYREVSISIFGAEGEAVSAAVLSDFTKEYGQDMAEELVSYQHVNFNVIDDETSKA